MFVCLTVKPGNWDAFKENQEEKAHPTGRVVVEEFEHVQSALQEESWKKKTESDTSAGDEGGGRMELVKQNNISTENNSGCGWCHLTDVRIYLCKLLS